MRNCLYIVRCGHCKQFAPEYEKIAQTLKENDPPIPVVKVDATKADAVASRFDVSGYPTIKILKNGEPVDYDGERTEKGANSGAALCRFSKRASIIGLTVYLQTSWRG